LKPFLRENRDRMKKVFFNFLVLIIVYIAIGQPVVFAAPLSVDSEKNSSVLASGNWIKISAIKSGVLKLTYDQLKQMGISSPENVSVYTNGGFMLPKMNNVDYPDDLQKIPVLHSKDKNGKQSVYFYSAGNTKWRWNYSKQIFVHELNLYSEKTYFYLTSDVSKSTVPENSDAITENASVTISTYNNYDVYEQENFNIANSGRLWFSDKIFQSSSKTYPFNLKDINNSQKASINIGGAAQSSDESKFIISIGNSKLGEFSFVSAQDPYKAAYSSSIFSTDASNELNVTINYQISKSSGNSWVDYITINYLSNLVFTDNQVAFRSADVLKNSVVEYQIQTAKKDAIIWNVTDPLNPLSVNPTSISNGLSFKCNGTSIDEFVVFSPATGIFEEPILEKAITNQNIHGLPAYEMVIVTHPDFITAAQDLAEFHRNADHLSVLVLTPEEIYNEYSSGLPDPAGIRNMLRHFYHKSTSTDSLRYVLLIGDGSYDNRHFDGTKNNFIPTWQSKESLEENYTFTTDDFYVLLDDSEGEYDGNIDAGIGRFPCSTLEEANLIVEKVINYTSDKAMGNWRNVITFIADDPDDGRTGDTRFISQSEDLIEIINNHYPGFYSEKIYFDSYPQISTSTGHGYPDVTQAIKQRVDKGSLILNYIGHANELTIADENILGINDVKTWNNKNALPIFVTATCEISRFDDNNLSIGEQILLNPSGGGVALFTTTRVVFDGDNFSLSKNFYNSVFKQDKNGNNYRMGDIMREAKNLPSDAVNRRKFALLGDPALQLAFPKYKVQTSSINGIEINSEDITIGALGKVKVKGFVADNNGTLQSNMNGTVSSTIYDKTVYVQTLANEGGSGYEYPIQSNIIYKGTSTVKNGEFEFTFIVPKDIAYNIEKGKISYYFSNDTIDGNGATEDFKIGGTSEEPIVDNNPPVIKVYLNNEKFKSNDKVASSALLLVNLSDESGINTVGTGIGHDIVAVLDDVNSNQNVNSDQIVLNDFYVSEADNFQKGKVLYPLNNLEPGEYTLTIKAWDVQNNSSEQTITFFVEEGFEIVSVSNYPNPVDFYTNFHVLHNLPGDVFDVAIELFTLQGYKVDEFSESVSSNGTTEADIRWDIANLKRPVNNRQILIYRVTMENLDGLKAIGTGKLILDSNN